MKVVENPYSDVKNLKPLQRRLSNKDEVASVKSFKSTANKLSQSVENLRDAGRRNIEEYPNHYQNYQKGKYSKKKLSFGEEIDKQLEQATEERPSGLRSNVVEKYVLDILS